MDLGAYEFQTPLSQLSYAWLQSYGLPTDGSADLIDSDGDGLNNWQEYTAGTDPTNADCALRVLGASPGATGVTVTWQSVTNRNYFVERATDSVTQAGFSCVASNLAGAPGTTGFTDTNAPQAGPVFYRVGAKLP